MGGSKAWDRRNIYTTPIATLRTISVADEAPAAVDALGESIDMSGSVLGLNTVNLYIQAAIGDVFEVWIDDGEGVWYFAKELTLTHDNEGFTIESIPTKKLTVIATTLGDSAVVKEEHTE